MGSAELDLALADARSRLSRALKDDDAAQSVMIALWRALIRGPVNVDRYLNAAIRRRRAELLRGKYRQAPLIEFTDELQLPEQPDFQPVREYSKFTGKDRTIVDLLSQGQSIADIAVTLGMTRAGVYKRVDKMVACND
jgi:DNA-directed RNA polymerase specialized sigma24 family protein